MTAALREYVVRERGVLLRRRCCPGRRGAALSGVTITVCRAKSVPAGYRSPMSTIVGDRHQRTRRVRRDHRRQVRRLTAIPTGIPIEGSVALVLACAYPSRKPVSTFRDYAARRSVLRRTVPGAPQSKGGRMKVRTVRQRTGATLPLISTSSGSLFHRLQCRGRCVATIRLRVEHIFHRLRPGSASLNLLPGWRRAHDMRPPP